MPTIPHEFWKELCEDAQYPMACVQLDHKFAWVNAAYEQLTGYSVTELLGRTWMSITDQDDVGGDLASVQDIINGKISQYAMSKRYIHKRQHLVPVDLIVRRFPESMLNDLVYFRVEACPIKATRPELDEVERRLTLQINELKRTMAKNEDRQDRVNVSVGEVHGDQVGRDKNSDQALKIIAGALVAVAIAVVWLFYYVSTTNKTSMPQPPPSIQGTK